MDIPQSFRSGLQGMGNNGHSSGSNTSEQSEPAGSIPEERFLGYRRYCNFHGETFSLRALHRSHLDDAAGTIVDDVGISEK